MRRLSVLLVLALALVALAIPAVGATAAPGEPTAQAAKLKNCDTPFTEARTAHRIQATGVGCKTAVKVALKVALETPKGCVKFSRGNKVKLVSPCVRLSYRCTSKPIVKGLGLEATCKRGAYRVTFQY